MEVVAAVMPAAAGLNRTRVELKRGEDVAVTEIEVSLNRTRVELKRGMAKGVRLFGGGFESNQSGIETHESVLSFCEGLLV